MEGVSEKWVSAREENYLILNFTRRLLEKLEIRLTAHNSNVAGQRVRHSVHLTRENREKCIEIFHRKYFLLLWIQSIFIFTLRSRRRLAVLCRAREEIKYAAQNFILYIEKFQQKPTKPRAFLTTDSLSLIWIIMGAWKKTNKLQHCTASRQSVNGKREVLMLGKRLML